MNYTDPDGKSVFHFLNGSPGWGQHAPQALAGYNDRFDDLAPIIGCIINGTKIELGNSTLRLWKGYYGGLGTGGEIGVYNKDGTSMKPDELPSMGILSTDLTVRNKSDGSVVSQYSEKKTSFWTTAFAPKRGYGKDQVYTESVFNFNSEKNAKSFESDVKAGIKTGAPGNYPHNGDEQFQVSRNGNSVIITWGKNGVQE